MNEEEIKQEDLKEEAKNEEDFVYVEETAEDSKKNEQDENLQVALKELEETKDRYKRVFAEFENYKKRSQKERDMLYNSLVSDIITSFLPIIDNLEKAVEQETSDENYKKGVELLLKQFKDILKSYNVEPIEALGKTFDPELHEAVSSVQDEEKSEKEVVQEFRKGYKIGTRVLRHSMVVVAN